MIFPCLSERLRTARALDFLFGTAKVGSPEKRVEPSHTDNGRIRELACSHYTHRALKVGASTECSFCPYEERHTTVKRVRKV